MSSAFYPLGMNSYNNRLPQGGYKTWKGTGVLSNPVGIASGHIRPLTNKDPGNIFQTGFGLPRPIKHFRKGRVIPVPSVPIDSSKNPVEQLEISLVDYNLNRHVKSSYGTSLGGGAGGQGLLNQVIDNPGSYVVTQNNLDEFSNEIKLGADCKTCQGVGIIVNYYPNNTYLTENPETIVTTPPLCCNEERKARRRVLPASTILKKNYYTTHYQYLQNRCQTYEQKAFNFQSNYGVDLLANQTRNPEITDAALKASKPGDPLSYLNTYVANCQPNGEIREAAELNLIEVTLTLFKNQHILRLDQIDTIKSLIGVTIKGLEDLYQYLNTLENPEKDLALAAFVGIITNPYISSAISGPTNPLGCKLVVYKPNNPQFAQQGGVASSTRILKLNVDTINCNLESFTQPGTCNLNVPFILKSKEPRCEPQLFTKNGNPKTCFRNSNDVTRKSFHGTVHRGIHWKLI